MPFAEYGPLDTVADQTTGACSVLDTPEAMPRNYDHVMVDIETLSLHKHKALILSVGLLEFDPTDPVKLRTGASKLMVLPMVPQILLGRRIDRDTQEFWRKQSAEARCHWEFPDNSTIYCLDNVISHVRIFCKGKSRVWANGSQFDLSNLDGLAEDLGDTQELWHYQAPRDMRSFVRETPITRQVSIGDALDIPGTAHEPVYDCISQAWQVWSHWNERPEL